MIAEALYVYRKIGSEVDRQSTGRGQGQWQPPEICGDSAHRAHYHQQYLAKNPNGYCGIGGCGVPFKIAELPVEKKA